MKKIKEMEVLGTFVYTGLALMKDVEVVGRPDALRFAKEYAEEQVALALPSDEELRIRREDHKLLSRMQSFAGAIRDKVVALVWYKDRNNKLTLRKFNPLAIEFIDGNWSVLGYCQLREATRRLRIDRIEKYAITLVKFEIPEENDPPSGCDFIGYRGALHKKTAELRLEKILELQRTIADLSSRGVKAIKVLNGEQ